MKENHNLISATIKMTKPRNVNHLAYLKLTLLILILLLFLANVSYAHNITMNFAFRIVDKNNTIHVNDTDYNVTQQNISIIYTALGKKSITSERGNAVFAMVHVGKTFLSAMFNTSYSSSDYLIQMKQDNEANKFLVSFTNGTWRNVESAMTEAGNKIPSRTLGNVVRVVRHKFPLFIRAEYDNIDIANSIRWDGPVKISITNQGISNGLANISFSLLSGG